MPKHKRGTLAGALLLIVLVLAGCGGTGRPAASSPQASSAPEAASLPQQVPEPEPSLPLYITELEWIPAQGATGYAPVAMNLLEAPREEAAPVASLSPGTAFVVLLEEGDWWQVSTGDLTGWLPHGVCFINLPDVVPSILYDNTNTYASLFVSSGVEIPGITGQALYDGMAENARLGRREFIMPVLYPMSKKIYEAQKAALAGGNCLKIYEAYRPNSTQQQVVTALTALADGNEQVMAGISTEPWSMNWFIATSVSNHQMGYAIDVSLVEIQAAAYETVGPFVSPVITSYREYEMPTRLHELSMAAAAFTGPVAATSETAWLEATPAATMNEAALVLQGYCTGAGLTPLASEWWHFNDLAARGAILANPGQGGFIAGECLSTPPI